LIRKTVLEVLRLLIGVHAASSATKLRWRFACTEGSAEEENEPPVGLRAYMVLAGEGLEFVPSQFVDRAKASATNALSSDQIRRMSAEDWAASETVAGTNISEALKRVPAGWATIVKGAAWPEMQGNGAVFRLPQSSKRIFIQVDFLEGKPFESDDSSEGEESAMKTDKASAGNQKAKSTMSFSWLGPLAGVAAAGFGFLSKSPPFKAGQKSRRRVQDLFGVLERLPGVRSGSQRFEADSTIGKFEQRVWMDFADADEAPVVLVAGGQSEAGRVISRKLVTAGYHVVLLKPGAQGGEVTRIKRFTPQGAVLAAAPVKLTEVSPVTVASQRFSLPDDLYDAVAGIDKMVLCDCDDEGRTGITGRDVKNLLATWMMYRHDFAESQRAYTTKVRLFNFDREADFDLWDVESSQPSDMCYGLQSCTWSRCSVYEKTAMFQGRFFEPVAQAQLRSPRLKLNFTRFGGIVFTCYNQGTDNKYSWFLRTSDFDETRVQYEFNFTCQASRWHHVRMPFNAFRPVRADGVPLPEEEAAKYPLRREDVVQMGIAFRLTGEDNLPEPAFGTNVWKKFRMRPQSVKVFRTQAEPQVVLVSKEDLKELDPEGDEEEEEEEAEEEMFSFTEDDDLAAEFRKAEQAAAAEIEELVRADAIQLRPEQDEEDADADADDLSYLKYGRPRSCAQAVAESGMAYTIIKVKGLNDHPGGKFPVSVRQASIREPPLSHRHHASLGRLSRGDAAELVVSSLTEPSCVNIELAAGESLHSSSQTIAEQGDSDLSSPAFEIASTVEEDVKQYMRQLTPNR